MTGKSVYCTNEKLRKWNRGPDFQCDGDADACKYLVRFGTQCYCGWTPPRVTLHQVIRSEAGCLFCRYATHKLTSAKCEECLKAEERINYVDERVEKEEEE